MILLKDQIRELIKEDQWHNISTDNTVDKIFDLLGITSNQSQVVDTDSMSRVEIIDEDGRSYVNWDPKNKVELSIQDEGKTLKVFISQK